MHKKYIHLVFFSDSHLGYDFPLRPRIKKRRRGNDFFRNFKSVLSYARQYKVDLVIHGGDLFFRSKVPDAIVDKVYQILTDFAEHDIPIYIVPGNHERSCLPPSLFLNHRNIYVFSHPKTYYLTISSIRLALSGFPFIRDNIRDRFGTILNNLDCNKKNVDITLVCMHQTIEGARVGPANYVFRKGEDVIPLSLLPDDATAVLCGHIHQRQILMKRVGEKKRLLPVIYPGSIERTSFAEINEKKGFYHLIFAKSGERIWYLKQSRFILLPTRPMINIFINLDQSRDRVETELLEKIKYIDKNSIVQLGLNHPVHNKNYYRLTINRIHELLPPTLTFQVNAVYQDGL